MVENDHLGSLPLDRGGGKQTSPPSSARPRDLATIINDISKWQNRAAEVRNGKKTVAIETIELEELKTALEKARQGKQEEGIRELLTLTKEIKNKLPNQTGPQKTWSEVAIAGLPTGAPTIATNVATTTRNTDSRKRRELIVTIRDKDQANVTAKRSPEAILEVLRSMEPRKATDKIVTLRRLPSKDLQLIMADEESRNELETSHEWLQAIAESAEMKKPLYTVWVHGVRVQGVPTSNQSQAIETIRKANERLHPGLQIARLSWRKRDLERTYGSLILDTTDYRAANNLIQKGLVHDGEIKNYVRFVRAVRVT
jgi:hypothetical protein